MGARGSKCCPWQPREERTRAGRKAKRASADGVVDGYPIPPPQDSSGGPPADDDAASLRREVESMRTELDTVRELVQSIGHRNNALEPPAPDPVPTQRFTSVQHVALQISTTVSGTDPDAGVPAGRGVIPQPWDLQRSYVGMPDPKKDIARRIEVVKKALEVAYENASKDPSVLKIFTLPEFFFRGNLGAYCVQDILGDAQNPHAFITLIQNLLAGEKWQSWLGVFGTIVAYKIAPEEQEETKYTVYNLAIVQQGGFTTRSQRGQLCSFILKQGVSSMDFLKVVPLAKMGAIISGPDNDYWLSDHQEHYLDGLRSLGRLSNDGGLLVGGIWIGIEVCLDHYEQRLKKNAVLREMVGQRPSQVQVVVSSGMCFESESIVVGFPGGIAMINDGAGMTESPNDKRSDMRVYKDHSAYENPKPKQIELFESNLETYKWLSEVFYLLGTSPAGPLLAIYPPQTLTDTARQWDRKH